MPNRRLPVFLTGLALVTSTLSVAATSAQAVAPTAAMVPAASVAVRTATTVPGRPPRNYVIPATSFFSFPNRSTAERLAIRNRVLNTINSTWGGPRTPGGLAREGNGTIRIATWSFNDSTVARALVAAHNRGVSVQLVAAKSANADHRPWKWLKGRLGQRLYAPGHPETREKVSFARECSGSCRGRGGTPHAKYFMFDNVGNSHVRNVVVQGSMNLTAMGYKGQWNQAQVTWSPTVYGHFETIYRQVRIGRVVSPQYRSFTAGTVTSRFFPMPGGRAGNDPVMKVLDQVRCTGATAGGNGNGRTKIRIIQYAIYGERGNWIAKKLRSLWSRGCDIKIIYAVSSRPVISILRNGSGRGPIPMKQSVITNSAREIVKYNHSKWMTVTGNWGGTTDAFLTMTGSANWSAFAFTGDEQFQEILSRTQANRYMDNFNKTWGQGSSHPPMFGVKARAEGRIIMRWTIPEQPTFGKGIYKYLSPNGE